MPPPMVRDDPEDVARWTWAGVGVMIVEFIIQLNWIICYYYFRDHAALKRRYPRVVVTINCFSLGLYIATILNYIWTQAECCENPFPSWRVVAISLVAFSVSVPNFLHIYRIYLSWFDLGWSQALEDCKWKITLDDDSKNKRSIQFFLKNRNGLLGNQKVILAYCMGWIISFSVAMVFSVAWIGHGYYNTQSRTISQWNIIIPAIHFLVMYLILPSYDDIWHLRKEIRLLCIGLFLNALSFMLYVTLSPPIPHSVNYAQFLLVIDQISITGAAITMFYVLYQSNLPTNVFSLYWNLQMSKKKGFLYRLQSASSGEGTGSPRKKSGVAAFADNLRAIFGSNEGFSAFCRHATREFNVENILWLVESEQFMAAHMQYVKSQELRSSLLTIDFASSVPQSSIVTQTEKQKSKKVVWWQALQLFERYIIENAMFGINISSDSRKDLYELFQFIQGRHKYSIAEAENTVEVEVVSTPRGDGTAEIEMSSDEREKSLSENVGDLAEYLSKTKDIDDLFRLLDTSRKEVWKIIILGVFGRFRRTDEYELWSKDNKVTDDDKELSLSKGAFKIF